MVLLSGLIINFKGREVKGLSKGRYDKSFAGEDGVYWVRVITKEFNIHHWINQKLNKQC